jgi:hypothetical protein
MNGGERKVGPVILGEQHFRCRLGSQALTISFDVRQL